LVLQALAAVDTHTVVPPLKVSPITVGPLAAVTRGPTIGQGTTGMAGRPSRAPAAAKVAGSGARGADADALA
jgi:hypothetical protein